MLRERLSLIVVLVVSTIALNAQQSYQRLLSPTLETVFDSTEAKFFQVITPEATQRYRCETYYIDGRKKFNGFYMDPEGTVEHGWFEYFYINGNKESAGNYTQGKKTGTWKRWGMLGEPKAERYYAQVEDEEEHYAPATYYGGEEAMRNELEELLIESLGERGFQYDGVVKVAFLIDVDGELRNPQIVHSTWSLYDKVALEAVRQLDAWKPATRDGTHVESLYIIPVVFRKDT